MIEYTVKVHKYKTEWYFNGLLHREDGPAIEWSNGATMWFKNGKLHREDGPAVEFYDIILIQEWYLDGVYYTKNEHKKKTNPVKELTVEEISKLLGYDVKIVKG